MANPLSYLKQWSHQLRGTAAKPSAQTPRQRSRNRRNHHDVNGLHSNHNGASNGASNGNPRVSPISQRLFRPERAVYKRPVFWLVLILGTGVAVPSALAYRMWVDVQQSVPDVKQALTFDRTGTITLKASDGKILQKVGPTAQESLTFDQIPEVVVQAFIAAEDRRFYEHHGVDYRSIARAAVANITSGDVVEGASTITQQLARIVFLNQDRSFKRKFKEIILAQRLEKDLGKDKVLERYLNLVYLGAGAYGVADASWIYFGKTIDQISIADVALIAGMAPAPSVYSPLVNPKAAREQRDKVISRMEANGVITAAQAQEAYSADVDLKAQEPKYLYSAFPYFTIYVKKQLDGLLSPEQIEAGGLVVETSLNTKWQKAAEKTVTEIIDEYGDWQGFEQASLVAIDPNSGEIRAMVGGTDFDDSQFNRVTQAQRQPGSTFKAFVYATAIATGMSPYKGYTDARYVVDGYEPKNYGGGYSGTVDLRRALTSSINIVAVKLLVDIGFDPVVAMAHRMGIDSTLLPAYSLALGSSEVNLLELTSAYGTFAAEGQHITPHGITRITNMQGEVLYKFDEKPKQAMDADTAAIMAWMLEGVVNGGTGGNAALPDRQVAGKTGTSEKNRDLWFIGFIPQLVTGVWLGNDDSSPTGGASRTAALAWYKFVSQFIEELPVEKFPKLPELGNRQGTIKAKPISPRRVSADRSAAREEESDRPARSESYSGSSSDSYSDSYSDSTPEPDDSASREPEYDSPESDAGYYNDQPVEDSAPPPAPAPIPAPEPVAPAPIVPPPAPVAPPPAPAPAPAPAPPQPNMINN